MDIADRKKITELKNQTAKLIRSKEKEHILPFLEENMQIIKFDNDLMIVWYLGMIAKREMKQGEKSVLEKENTMEKLLDRYCQLKFYLRRIEYDILDDADEFYAFLKEHDVSEYELLGLIDNSVFEKEKVRAFFGG